MPLGSGRWPLVCLLIGLVSTFLTTRLITRWIRSGSRPTVSNWHVGDLHIHHGVFGVLVLVLAGYLEFVLQPQSPGIDLVSALFGAGVGLTLDEFALYLHLDDVYWRPEGRISIDAVFLAVAITGLLLFGAAIATSAQVVIPRSVLIATGTTDAALATVSILKGKPVAGIVGLILPPVALVAAIRLAKPSSVWARRHYSGNRSKSAAAQRRFGAAYTARWNRLRDLVGGMPTGVAPLASAIEVRAGTTHSALAMDSR